MSMEDESDSCPALGSAPDVEVVDRESEGSKMREIQSFVEVEGMDTHYPESSKAMDGNGLMLGTVNAVGAHELDKDAKSDLTDTNRSLREVGGSHKLLDLNSEASPEGNTAANDHFASTNDVEKDSPGLKCGASCGDKGKAVVGGLDLNIEDISISAINDPFHPYTFKRQLKYRDVLECGSTTGPVGDKDPMKKWKEMKQNGFVSPSYYGGIPAPQQQGRKSKSDAHKKRVEQAKKEQVDRFTKLAAPTGLLSSLNPGIINHVRNRKQVHSIIKSLLVSKEQENQHHRVKQMGQIRGLGDAGSRSKELKLGITSKETGFLSNGDVNGVDSLSIDAANVASQWLQLLHLDITARLAALRCSRNRVQNVITAELPLMMAKEFSTNQENETGVARGSAPGHSYKRVAALHQSYWGNRFNKMDKELHEEEQKLGCWLNQVEIMKLHCDHALQKVRCDSRFCLHQSGAENCSRSDNDELEQIRAVKAAAASLYSTCKFLLFKENVTCF